MIGPIGAQVSQFYNQEGSGQRPMMYTPTYCAVNSMPSSRVVRTPRTPLDSHPFLTLPLSHSDFADVKADPLQLWLFAGVHDGAALLFNELHVLSHGDYNASWNDSLVFAGADSPLQHVLPLHHH